MLDLPLSTISHCDSHNKHVIWGLSNTSHLSSQLGIKITCNGQISLIFMEDHFSSKHFNTVKAQN